MSVGPVVPAAVAAMRLELWALLTWVITAAFGFSLFFTRLARGGISQHSGMSWLMTFNLPPPYLPAPLVFSHLLLAAGRTGRLDRLPAD